MSSSSVQRYIKTVYTRDAETFDAKVNEVLQALRHEHVTFVDMQFAMDPDGFGVMIVYVK